MMEELPTIFAPEVLLPGSTLRIADQDPAFINLVKAKFLAKSAAFKTSIVAVLPKCENQTPQNIGTAASVIQVTGTNWPKPFYSLLVTGLYRIRIEQILSTVPFHTARVEQLEPHCKDFNPELEVVTSKDVAKSADILRHSLYTLAITFGTSKKDANTFLHSLKAMSPNLLSDIACQYISLNDNERLTVLSKVNTLDRLNFLLPMVEKQIETFKTTPAKRLSLVSPKKNYVVVTRSGSLDDLLRNATRSRQLSDYNNNDSDDKDDLEEIKSKISELPSNSRDNVAKEFDRLCKMSSHMPDYNLTKNYLQFCVDLPWSKLTEDRLDLNQALSILNSKHYGLEQVKQRLIEFLAVRKSLQNANEKQTSTGPLLCLIGPPGVGKTSIARSLAEVMGRKFQRVSLGGVCDHADIRGHRRTYVGAMPGRILQAVKNAGVRNPVILLDEIDKTCSGIHGDPAAALLEVLDSEQNGSFVDHYLNIPFDLSQIIFIATANSSTPIIPALIDRMELIEVPSYTTEEKIKIVKEYLLPKQLSRHGLNLNSVEIEDKALLEIVRHYTREAGIRQAERKIEKICRYVCTQLDCVGDMSSQYVTDYLIVQYCNFPLGSN